MKNTMKILILGLLVWLVSGTLALAGDREDAENLIEKSRIAFDEMLRSPDSVMPDDLLRDCAGLVIIPEMIKGGFIFGGAYGQGIVLAHRDGKWLGPAFVYIGAASVGFQIGAESVGLILVVLGQKTMDSFLRASFKLGGDVAIAAGPVGAQVTAATDIMLKGGIFSYSRAKGLFAGVSLEGAGMGSLAGLNRAYYNTRNVKSILYGNIEKTPTVSRLIETLKKYKK
jgi:lipid-binding SYLF domain-containing protein